MLLNMIDLAGLLVFQEQLQLLDLPEIILVVVVRVVVRVVVPRRGNSRAGSVWVASNSERVLGI